MSDKDEEKDENEDEEKNKDNSGFLTESDKDWLHGDIEYKHLQSETNKRADIRNRTATALRDFEHLNEQWTEDERRRLLEEIDDPEAVVAGVIEFLYLWLNERAADPEEMVGSQAVDKALTFQRALCRGILNGKQHFGSVPEWVLLDSNVELFEIPSADSLQRELSTEQWRRLNEHVRNAMDEDEDTVIGKDEAAKQYHTGLRLTIGHQLHTRRGVIDSEIKRHDQIVASTTPLFNDE